MCRHDVAVALAGQGPHEAKVPNLGLLLRGQEDVARCQISVHEELGFQVGHSFGHLESVAPELVERVGRT